MGNDNAIGLFIGLFVLVILAIAISAGNSVPPHTEPSTKVDQRRLDEARTKDAERQSGGLCAGVCVGPHINLGTGKIGIISTGVGIQF